MEHSQFESGEVVLPFRSCWRMIDYTEQPLKVEFGSGQLDWMAWEENWNISVKLKLILCVCFD